MSKVRKEILSQEEHDVFLINEWSSLARFCERVVPGTFRRIKAICERRIEYEVYSKT